MEYVQHKNVASFDDKGPVYFRSYMVLEPTGNHSHSNHYYFDDTPDGLCSCQLPNHQHEELDGEYEYIPLSDTHHGAVICWCEKLLPSQHMFRAYGLNQAICIDCGFIKTIGFDTPIVSPLDIDLPPVQTNTSNEEEKEE